MRKPFICGNWKMFKTIAEGVDFVKALSQKELKEGVEYGVAAPFTMLKSLCDAAAGTDIKICAQNMHFEDQGAFTGEISAPMLKELGIQYVLIGHSERRQYFAETDETVNKKVLKALSVGINPILCCGESLDEREAGRAKDVVKAQILKDLEGVASEKLENVVIAYEPIWAIGTGKTASSDDANDMIAFIRCTLAEMFSQTEADKVRIQYGGSVKPDNVADIMSKSDIDGALVGGASLKIDDYVKLINF